MNVPMRKTKIGRVPIIVVTARIRPELTMKLTMPTQAPKLLKPGIKWGMRSLSMPLTNPKVAALRSERRIQDNLTVLSAGDIS